MGLWRHERSMPPNHHLPPPDVCSNLYVAKDQVKIRHTFETPTDEHGLPDIVRTLQLVDSMVDPEYEWPQRTNVHHIAYPRRLYHQTKLGHDFREGSAMMFEQPIQQHNLLHRSLEPAPLPSDDLMRECVREQRVHDTLFTLGSRAIRYERWARQLEDEAMMKVGRIAVNDAVELSQYYKSKAIFIKDSYQRVVERQPDTASFRGLVPPQNELVDMHATVPKLGRRSAAGHTDAYRAVQSRNGFDRILAS